MTIEFKGADEVVAASSCALERQYATKPHSKCSWCDKEVQAILKAVYGWMRNPDNSGEIARGDRGDQEPWLL